MKLTLQAKLDALAYRFYQDGAWTPKAGDYYTTSRADLELYQVVAIENGTVRTRYTEGSDVIAEWPEAEFMTAGFGPRRVFVPEWVLANNKAPIVDGQELDVVTRGELEHAVALLAGTTSVEDLPSHQIEKLMTVGQYLTDRGLAEIERRGELVFIDGQPSVPYLSTHVIESILTRSDTDEVPAHD